MRAWLSILLVSVLLLQPTGPVRAAPLPGFQETVVFSGLDHPTSIQFASDGRIFVAEKRGIIKIFDSLTDPAPDIFADLNVNVHNFWDRGLLGMALDPDFPSDPHVYVLYTYDAAIGGTAPRWGTPGVYSDPCPTPPGPTADGCVVSGRLSRLTASGNSMIGDEMVLVEDWCQQYPSHSTGSLVFGADGALYASAGDGASFNWVDYGQDGNPLNPCGDPPGGVGGVQTPPTAEGGALRSQDLRTSGDPVGLDGTIIRIDPATGTGLPDNPLAGDSDANARRIVADGLRNPFRITSKPGTNEIWIGDVGWNTWEEINRLITPNDNSVDNFGWPCYEGNSRQSGYDGANLNICENLYTAGNAVIQPVFAYNHNAQVVPGEACSTGSSSIAGMAFEFYGGGPYPSEYDGALFFTDYSRDCIWVMKAGTNGVPNPGLISTFLAPAANPVDLKISPAGDLYYADFDGGTIRRIQYTSLNTPPTSVATADPTTGTVPLTVSFDGSASSDPDPDDTISYAWDLNGDGLYDESTSVSPTYTYQTPGIYSVSLKVTDNHNASNTAGLTINVGGNTPPAVTIISPSSSTKWRVGDTINFTGSATDVEDGSLPVSALSWSLVLYHCPSNCHTHPLQDFVGVSSGSFSAPDHEYPSYLELTLRATDSGGLASSQSIRLDPQTVVLTFQSSPSGLSITVNGITGVPNFKRTVIVGSSNTISAISPQVIGNRTYVFISWSDGGTQTHTIIAPASPVNYQAKFRKQ